MRWPLPGERSRRLVPNPSDPAGLVFFFQAEDGIRDLTVTGVQTCALPIWFRLAGALLLPGDLTRADALVLEGRIAARMIGAVVTLLALAGTIEGLLSASDAPGALKYGVCAATVEIGRAHV